MSIITAKNKRLIVCAGKKCVNLKSTGIVRKVDELGRVVLPIELRRTLGIGERDALEIYVDQDSVILKKYVASCVFCGDTNGVKTYKGKNICSACMRELRRI